MFFFTFGARAAALSWIITTLKIFEIHLLKQFYLFEFVLKFNKIIQLTLSPSNKQIGLKRARTYKMVRVIIWMELKLNEAHLMLETIYTYVVFIRRKAAKIKINESHDANVLNLIGQSTWSLFSQKLICGNDIVVTLASLLTGTFHRFHSQDSFQNSTNFHCTKKI